MEQIPANDLLNINISISATPLVQFEKEDGLINNAPNTIPSENLNGFSVYIDVIIKYDSLSHVVNQYIKNKRLQISEGIINQYITFDHCELYGVDNNQLQVSVAFSGSYDGTFYLTGTPVYDTPEQSIVIQSLHYKLVTDNLLLKAAKWLFNKKIMKELNKFTSLSLTEYYRTASKSLDALLTKEWRKGIKTNGEIAELNIVSVEALPEHIVVRSYCNGSLVISINELNLAASK